MEKKNASRSFRDLIVWQRAHQMVLNVYKLSKSFPKEECYALTPQIRRSSVSVAANIAEAFKKKSVADKLRILNIAQGSLSETEYYFILSHDLEYGDVSELIGLADEVGRLLEAYMDVMRNNSKS